MNDMVILCVEDEVEVRNAIVRDIAPFAQICRIDEAEDAADAKDAVSQCLAAGDHLALVLCDHMLPGQSGVDFLVTLHDDARTRATRKVLVTGQAGLEDTVKAVNRANLDHYITKPWSKETLHATIKEQLTNYVLECVENVLPYVSLLDGPRLLAAQRDRITHE